MQLVEDVVSFNAVRCHVGQTFTQKGAAGSQFTRSREGCAEVQQDECNSSRMSGQRSDIDENVGRGDQSAAIRGEIDMAGQWIGRSANACGAGGRATAQCGQRPLSHRINDQRELPTSRTGTYGRSALRSCRERFRTDLVPCRGLWFHQNRFEPLEVLNKFRLCFTERRRRRVDGR